MKKTMIITTLALFVVFAMSVLLYLSVANGFLYSLAITLGTCFYHFAMRLAVGYAIDDVCKNGMDYTKAWFKEKRFEQRLYKMLRVRRWKAKVPTFRPEDFDVAYRTPEVIARATCQSEVTHEVIMLLSFAPLAVIPIFGDAAVFIVTSCAACAVDAVFVLLQRYNRPRLLKMIKHNG